MEVQTIIIKYEGFIENRFLNPLNDFTKKLFQTNERVFFMNEFIKIKFLQLL